MINSIFRSRWHDVGLVQIRTRPLPGRFPVGVCHYHAVDPTRMDQADSVSRQFMVAVFYPAEAHQETAGARFVDIFEPMVEDALACLADGVEPEKREELQRKMCSFGLQATRDGRPQRSAAPYPTLIYYPAGGANRFVSADVCEALASHGFVVFAVDGPHDADLVVFPDGHLCKANPRFMDGDFVSPGAGDVGYLLSQLDRLNSEGVLKGMIDNSRVGLFGHSRGGYIANVSAFQNDRVRAVASIDCFLWGFGNGLEGHSPDFRAKVRSTSKPVMRLCGRPAGTDPQDQAEFCLKRDGGDFIGEMSVVAFPGWSHLDFQTTPWLAKDLIERQSKVRSDAAETLTDILATFFATHLSGRVGPDQLKNCIRKYPASGLASRTA